MEKARRYNNNKLRYDLIPTRATNKIAEVYTKGAIEYSDFNESGKMIYDGSENWRKGMSWMSIYASIQRHLEKWKRGEDVDDKMGTLHLANAAWGMNTLIEYMDIASQFDDRKLPFVPNIGLDIDGVIANFSKSYATRIGKSIDDHKHWHFTYQWKKERPLLNQDKDFWLNIEPMNQNLGFEPVCYVTNREIPIEWIEEWIEKNGFPCEPIYQGNDKAKILKDKNIDFFIDDSYHNYRDLNQAGIPCFLYTQPWNEKYVNVKRIDDLSNFGILKYSI